MKGQFAELKRSPPGERFATFHEHHQRQSSRATRVMMCAASVLTFLIGVVLVFIPGPAFVFFLLTGALLAAQSHWVASRMDSGELWARRLVDDWKRKHRS